MSSALPYHEPTIQTLLIQSSFLIVLNGINHVLDSVLYSGLVGQILAGIAWGVPGGNILDQHAQEVIVQLGYIGLILLVFEGGLSTSFSSLKANLFLSILVAITGIAAPMGLSFVLSPLAGASSLQAFAAGAALCSTSLGTTFTLLATSGLSSTRLGVVLTSAAMMDDVVGLIMVQVISNLGSSPSLDAVTVIRPVFVSLAFAILLPLACRFIVLPTTKFVAERRGENQESAFNKLVESELTALVIHTCILVATVAGATYAGSSALLGAYIAGAMISWWDAEAPHPRVKEATASTSVAVPEAVEMTTVPSDAAPETAIPSTDSQVSRSSNSGAHIFEKYYAPSLQRILKPFFFASVGFSIPITQMFIGSVVWRGLIFTVLMTVGKLLCGLWLLPVPNPLAKLQTVAGLVRNRMSKSRKPAATGTTSKDKKAEKPISLYPGLILGCAMVSRGEIGYLISSLAEGQGVFSNSSSKRAEGGEPSEIFLIVTWAITLCTIAGPVSMGLLVDRVRKLEAKASERGTGARSNVLGSWGVS